jgi:hypothetical protein
MAPDPKQIGAVASAAIALIFLIAAAGVPDWQHNSTIGIKAGIFKVCYQDICVDVEGCTAGSGGSSSFKIKLPECDAIRATQAFIILSILITAAAVACMILTMFMNMSKAKLPAFALAIASAFCCLIAFAVFTKVHDGSQALAGNDKLEYGAGFALTIVAWILNMAATALWFIGAKPLEKSTA